jgi:hypothetical protein
MSFSYLLWAGWPKGPPVVMAPISSFLEQAHFVSIAVFARGGSFVMRLSPEPPSGLAEME